MPAQTGGACGSTASLAEVCRRRQIWMTRRVDFDGMDVESPTGEHLGDVDGFIVDATADGPTTWSSTPAAGSSRSISCCRSAMPALDADRAGARHRPGASASTGFRASTRMSSRSCSEADMKRFNDDTCVAITGERSFFRPTNRSQRRGSATTTAIPIGGMPRPRPRIR